MRTHLDLDDALLEQALRLGGLATKTAVVNTALAAYVKSLRRQEVLQLRGKVQWRGDLNRLRMDRIKEA